MTHEDVMKMLEQHRKMFPKMELENKAADHFSEAAIMGAIDAEFEKAITNSLPPIELEAKHIKEIWAKDEIVPEHLRSADANNYIFMLMQMRHLHSQRYGKPIVIHYKSGDSTGFEINP